jgi:hypothetical protein
MDDASVKDDRATTGAALTPRLSLDHVVCAVFFLAGALLGRSALIANAHAGTAPAFYQAWLAPAAFDACGLGFVDADPAHVPARLADFLALKSDGLTCADLPREGLQPANWFAQRHRYLAASLTLLWKIRGIRWSALTPLFALCSGLVAALAYLLFRIGMNPWWSMAGAAAIAGSGLNLFYLHKLRDYSKAPFLLASLWVIGLIATRPASTRRLLLRAGLCGGIIGIGLGFRTDAIVAVPLFLLTIVCFLPSPRPAWRVRVLALAVFIAGLVLTGWPLLGRYGGGSNSPHVTLLGFTDQFAAGLGLARTDYTVNALYADRPIEMAVRNYAMLTTGGSGWLVLTSPTYDRLAGRYLGAVAMTVPGDVLMHAYAATLRVFESPFDRPEQDACAPLQPSLAGRVCAARNAVLSPLRWCGPIAAALLVLGTIAVDARSGWFLVAVVAIFAGSTTLQFDPRHTFYLEFMPLWAMAFLAQRALSVPRLVGLRIRDGRGHGHGDSDADAAGAAAGPGPGPGPGRRYLRRGALRLAVAVIVLVIVPATALVVARVVQTRTLTTLFARYLAADVDPLPVTWSGGSPASGTMPLDDALPPLDPAMVDRTSLRSMFLRAEFGGAACAGRASTVGVRYRVIMDGVSSEQAFALPWSVPLTGERVMVFIPIYRALLGPSGDLVPAGEYRPKALEMPSAGAPCLLALSAIRRPEQFPLRIMASLGPEWAQHRLYQTMAASDAPDTAGAAR